MARAKAAQAMQGHSCGSIHSAILTFEHFFGAQIIWDVKKQVVCMSIQKVRGGGGGGSGGRKLMSCLEIASEAVYKSKLPSVLSVAFGKQNS